MILGGRGNLGTQLTNILAPDHELLSLDREELDVLDRASLREAVLNYNPAVLINCVAYNAVDKCEEKGEYEIALRLNADFPGFLAELAVRQKFLLVHYSTDYVFNGTAEKQSFSEGETPNPINKYGETKFQGEVAISKLATQGLRYYLIRTSKLFGPLGSSVGSKPSFFDIMMNLSQNKKELSVVDEELSCFTYTPDLALATKRLIEAGVPDGIYHLINEGPVTWYEAAKTMFKLQKISPVLRSVRSENLLRAARRPKFSVLANTKTKRLRNWQEALKEYLSIS